MGQTTQLHTAAENRDIDLSHQEVQRLIEELVRRLFLLDFTCLLALTPRLHPAQDNVYEMSQSEWLAAEPVAMFLCALSRVLETRCLC